MNFGKLKERAAQLCQLAGIENVQPSIDWALEVNDALEQFSFEAEYIVGTTTVSTVLGTSTYTLALGVLGNEWKRVTDCVSGTGTRLYQTDANAIRQEDPNWILAPNGEPSRWMQPGPGKIQFWPTPNATGTIITVRGYKQDGPLIVDTDVPLCAKHFHEGIALLAAWDVGKLFATGENVARVNGYREEANDIMKSLNLSLLEQNSPIFQRRVGREGPERMPLGWARSTP